mmetsp:Transcript_79339/g.125124  ORF Transcript_79339/g.125124 Transcript_79339/m.125124 type:complete len:211 (-) Transcript_79339:7-639(-)
MGHLAQFQELQGFRIQLRGQEAHQNVHGKANVHQNPNRFPARQSVTPEVCQLNRDHTSQHEGAHRHQAVPTEAEQGVGHQHIPAFRPADTAQIFLLPGPTSHGAQAARLRQLIWRSRFQGPVVCEGAHLTSRPRRKRGVVILLLRNLQLHVLHRRRSDGTSLRLRAHALIGAAFQRSIHVGGFQVPILFLAAAALAALVALFLIIIIRGV